MPIPFNDDGLVDVGAGLAGYGGQLGELLVGQLDGGAGDVVL
jgi:hypothetical protein